MIKILLVEDDANKRKSFADTLLSIPGMEVGFLDVATDVSEAKQKLKSKGYDLLLLDIHLPKRADKFPEPAGGLELLRWLKAKGTPHRPNYVVGTTAYDDSMRLAQAEFNNLLWTIIPFSFSDNSWQAKLSATVGLILDQVVPPYSNDGVTFKTDALIVTALDDPEFAAVLGLPLNWTESPVRHDDSRYFVGGFKSSKSEFTAVAVCASDKGLSSAAIVTTKAIQTFRPKYVFMVGICAGVKKRVAMGDLIVADPSWDWGSGKEKLGINGKEFFHPAQYQMRLDEGLRSAASKLKGDGSALEKAHKSFAEKKPKKASKVHVAAFASGAAVLQSPKAVLKILGHHKDLKAVDMEVYSVMYACHIASRPRPLCVAVKSVCDFGDGKKNDHFQKYAATMSATFAFEFLKQLYHSEA